MKVRLSVALALVLLGGGPFAFAQQAPPSPAPDEAAIRKALEADAAKSAASSATPAAGTDAASTLPEPAPARPAGGTNALNPNISAIVDGSFGYYGRHHA